MRIGSYKIGNNDRIMSFMSDQTNLLWSIAMKHGESHFYHHAPHMIANEVRAYIKKEGITFAELKEKVKNQSPTYLNI